MTVNPRFKAFVEACRRHPAAHKHPLENFLFRPPARLQRYHLHLESILKKTEEGNHDRESLQNAIDIINDQCKTAQAGVESAELKVKIREYAYNLSAKRTKYAIDMDLLNPGRQLIHQGRVLRKPDAFDFDWTSCWRSSSTTTSSLQNRNASPRVPMMTAPMSRLHLPRQELASCSRNDPSCRDARDQWSHGVVHLTIYRSQQLPYQQGTRGARFLAFHHLASRR